MNYRFVGTTEVTISPDPTEFVGLTVHEAAQALEKLLADEYPKVDVPYNDIVMAADELVTFACAIES